MSDQTMPRTFVTHSETFHTDDVFATAMLLKVFPDAQIIRSRDDAVIAAADVVYDVGKIYNAAKGRFDHHQAQAGARDNGIIYSAFGLLWREYGVQYCDGDAAVAAYIDRTLVMPIDAIDNGQTLFTPTFEDVNPFTIDDVIGDYNPCQWLDLDEAYDTQFHEAVKLAQAILARVYSHAKDKITSQNAVLTAYNAAEDKRIIFMERPASLSDILDQCPDLRYVISERPEKTWGVLAVAVAPNSFQSRQPFPEAWRAKSADELVKLTGVLDVAFCHANGFFAVCRSREGALALAQKSLATTD